MEQKPAAVSQPTSSPRESRWRSWLPSPGNVLFVMVVAAALFLYERSAEAEPASAPAAASTATIPYQGRLADSGGSPLNGSYAMTFKLYNVANNGGALWTETWSGGNSVSVSNGLFNVMLGSLTPMPQSLFSDNTSLWLGVKVGADSEMAPRVQLGSAPFAMQALTVPDGSIGYNKLSLLSGGTCLSADTPISLPGDWATSVITGSAVSLSLPISATVLVWASGVHNTNPVSGYVGTTIDVDGVQLTGINSIPPNTGWYDWAMIRQTSMSPGNHQLSMRAFSQSATTVTYAGSAGSTCLQYLVMSH
jgi:hypothetical protein